MINLFCPVQYLGRFDRNPASLCCLYLLAILNLLRKKESVKQLLYAVSAASRNGFGRSRLQRPYSGDLTAWIVSRHSNRTGADQNIASLPIGRVPLLLTRASPPSGLHQVT
jgi:hypothetical protein